MNKEQFLKFKEDLKQEAKQQRELKKQRKSEHFIGERTVSPYDAAEKVRDNKYRLDKKYVIYYILKHQIEITERTKEQVLWETYVKLHPKHKDARHISVVGWDNHTVINYYIECEWGRDYTPDYAMRDLMKMYDEIIKQYNQVEPRLYVIIDESLEPVYGCVQGGHAVAQYLLENPNSRWKNNYLIYLKSDIMKMMNKLDCYGISYTIFKEPDLNNKITAIAVLDNREMFKKLKLIGS